MMMNEAEIKYLFSDHDRICMMDSIGSIQANIAFAQDLERIIIY